MSGNVNVVSREVEVRTPWTVEPSSLDIVEVVQPTPVSLSLIISYYSVRFIAFTKQGMIRSSLG